MFIYTYRETTPQVVVNGKRFTLYNQNVTNEQLVVFDTTGMKETIRFFGFCFALIFYLQYQGK